MRGGVRWWLPSPPLAPGGCIFSPGLSFFASSSFFGASFFAFSSFSFSSFSFSTCSGFTTGPWCFGCNGSVFFLIVSLSPFSFVPLAPLAPRSFFPCTLSFWSPSFIFCCCCGGGLIFFFSSSLSLLFSLLALLLFSLSLLPFLLPSCPSLSLLGNGGGGGGGCGDDFSLGGIRRRCIGIVGFIFCPFCWSSFGLLCCWSALSPSPSLPTFFFWFNIVLSLFCCWRSELLGSSPIFRTIDGDFCCCCCGLLSLPPKIPPPLPAAPSRVLGSGPGGICCCCCCCGCVRCIAPILLLALGGGATRFILLITPTLPVLLPLTPATIFPSCSLSFGNLLPISLGFPKLTTPSAKNSPLLPIGCEIQSSLCWWITTLRPTISAIVAPTIFESYIATPNAFAFIFPKSPILNSADIPGQPWGFRLGFNISPMSLSTGSVYWYTWKPYSLFFFKDVNSATTRTLFSSA